MIRHRPLLLQIILLIGLTLPAPFLLTQPLAANTFEGNANTMNLPECPDDDFLPSVRELSDNQPQRIAYPEGDENATGVYGKLTNGQRIAGHLTPEIHAGMSAQSGSLLRNGSIDPALREMIIVRTGYQTASYYEVAQHRSLAESLGVTIEKLDALACVRPQGLDSAEASVIAFVDELLTINRTSDAVLEAVRAHFTDGQVMEMIFVTGNWWTLARMLETAGIPLDAARIGDKGVAPANKSSN